jgi:hypothetical protein
MRFKDAQTGDRVWSDTFGRGVIRGISGDVARIYFYDCGTWEFYVTGRFMSNLPPSLFYIDGENRYATERPKPKLDWSKVPVDTEIFIDGTVPRYFSHKQGALVWYFAKGATQWSANGNLVKAFDSVELAEPVTVDGVTYPIGTKFEGE